LFKQYFQAIWKELWAQKWKTPIYRRPRFTAAFSMFPKAAVNRGFTNLLYLFDTYHTMKRIYRSASSNQESYHRRQKQAYDRKCVDLNVKTGDYVMLQKPKD
jgi:hypothetical protein